MKTPGITIGGLKFYFSVSAVILLIHLGSCVITDEWLNAFMRGICLGSGVTLSLSMLAFTYSK